jgi:hypothetical protein
MNKTRATKTFQSLHLIVSGMVNVEETSFHLIFNDFLKRLNLFLTTIFIRLFQTEFTCVQDGKFAYNSCTQFYECLYTNSQSAIKYLYDCPTGTLFAQNLQICDFPSQVICPNAATNLAATTIETTTETNVISTSASTTTTG